MIRAQKVRAADDIRGNGARITNRSAELAARRTEHAERERTRTTSDDWSSVVLASAVQRRAFDAAIEDLHDGVSVGNHEVFGDPLPAHLPGGAVQLRRRMATRSDDERRPAEVHAARVGVQGSGGAMPFLERIEASFGAAHDLSGVSFHDDAAAREASSDLGAAAYATGESIAFGVTPDLHTVAHEAAHVIQQRAGVSLAGAVGEAGDRYERHADAVADAVVRGEDAAGLLAPFSSGSPRHVAAVQRVESKEPGETGGEERGEIKTQSADKRFSVTIVETAEGKEIKAEGELIDPETLKMKLPALMGVPGAGIWPEVQGSVRLSGSAKVSKSGTTKLSVAVIVEGRLTVRGGLETANVYGGASLRLKPVQVEVTHDAKGWRLAPMVLKIEGDLRGGVEFKPLGSGKGPNGAKLSTALIKIEYRTGSGELLVVSVGQSSSSNIGGITVELGKDALRLRDTIREISELDPGAAAEQAARGIVTVGEAIAGTAKVAGNIAKALIGEIAVQAQDLRGKMLRDAATLRAMLGGASAGPGPGAQDDATREAVEAVMGTLYGYLGADIPDPNPAKRPDDRVLMAWHEGISHTLVGEFPGMTETFAGLRLPPATAAALLTKPVIPFLQELARLGLVAVAKGTKDAAPATETAGSSGASPSTGR